jgi:hypothetical protein
MIHDTKSVGRRDRRSARRGVLSGITAMLLLVLTATPAVGQEDSVAVAQADSLIAADSISAATDSAIAEADTLRESHPQDSPGATGFAFYTPNQEGQLRIRASIRLNGAYDFNGLQDTDNFDTYLIPVGETPTEQARFYLQATQTRIGFELSQVTTGGVVFGRIESDFRGPSNTFRLRHAFGEYRHVLAGQTWSTFSDVEALPVTVDLEGPPSSTTVRTPQVRYSATVNDSMSWAVAIEAPLADITNPDSTVGDAYQGFGDITARARLSSDWGHLQMSAVLRTLSAKGSEGETDFLPGLGAMLSGRSQVAERDAFLFQAIGGMAISRFVGSLGGKGLDLVYNPFSGRYEQMLSYGGFVTWNHQRLFDLNLETNLTGGYLGVQNKDFQPADSYKNSQYISANAFWVFTEGGRTGVEFSWGRRTNKDGERGTATRLSFAAYFDF